MTINNVVGFLGAGQMAEALARGFLDKDVLTKEQLVCTDPVPARRQVFESFGAKAFESAKEVCEKADVIFVCTKPQYVSQVLSENHVTLANKLVVSIAAGVTLDQMTRALGNTSYRVIRVMPNTPCLVGETAAAMCHSASATAADIKVVQALFEAVGIIKVVDEKLLSAVTGLSGSGPAYVFVMIEALADGGVRAGLPRDIALELATQTVLGGAKMVKETRKHPGELKDMVTSPGGTTIAGIHALEVGGIRAILMNAVQAATDRANELSKL